MGGIYPVEMRANGYEHRMLGSARLASATLQSSYLAEDWQLFAIVGLVVAVLVWGLILYAAFRFRRRGDDDAPVQFRNNVRLEIAWTVLPLLLVCALFVRAYHAEANVDALAPNPAVTIDVRGYRWGWTFAYRGGPTVGGASGAPVLDGAAEPPPQLVLPVGETTQIDLTSVDVNHSFWIPEFLYKRDAIPGQINRFDLQPEQLGVFQGHCAAFCGLDHALMNFTIRVVSPADFARFRRGGRLG